ncbi:MAG TPA: SDR family oxidoreductase [Mycobacteriales bacterium]|nr:SDR family oxidoreductase [Mycobacteriales bacterium]
MELPGRCAVVTGGAHGIGRALAEELCARGAHVVVADVNADRARVVGERLGGIGIGCDVSDPDAIAAAVQTAEQAFGPVEVLCSNAGYTDHDDGMALSRQDLQRIVEVNLLSHVWAAQAVVPGMVERGRGWLVQTISSAALITGPSFMGYTLTKHGALGFAEWLSLNYSHLGISVTALCPNAVNTGMMGRDEAAEERTGNGPTSAPPPGIGEVVEPEECARMALDAAASGRFLVLPHPGVGESFQRKAADYDHWLERTNTRLRRMRGESV